MTNGNSIFIDIDGENVRTFRDILPDKPGLNILFVAKVPTPKSVGMGHYFQGRHGKMFWGKLKEHAILKQTTEFEDDSLLSHGFGITDIVKKPRDFGIEPTIDEYRFGTSRIIDLVKLHQPKVVVFVYKAVLDNILKIAFGVKSKAKYGFNPGVDEYFGTPVFAFPMPGTPCTTEESVEAMEGLVSLLAKT